MRPAAWPRLRREEARLLVVDPSSARHAHADVAALPRFLRAGDVLVVNDAATIPASLHARTPNDAPIELRFAGRRDDGAWRAVLLGAGDWRTRTEDRPAPPQLRVGTRLAVGAEIAEIVAVSTISARLVDLRFRGGEESAWRAIYGAGAPVQYAYLRDTLRLWDVQTSYGGLPFALEMPSAGRPLSWSVLLDARRRGVAITSVTHAAGLSSTGDGALDAVLPLDEELVVSRASVRTIADAKRRGGRVIAVGTSVVRALEGNAASHDGALVATRQRTSLRIDRNFTPRVVDGLLSGIHEEGSSHLELVGSFVSEATLRAAYASAEQEGYTIHELGDVCLVLDETLGRPNARGSDTSHPFVGRSHARHAQTFRSRVPR